MEWLSHYRRFWSSPLRLVGVAHAQAETAPVEADVTRARLSDGKSLRTFCTY
jgi:hypothetical protein